MKRLPRLLPALAAGALIAVNPLPAHGAATKVTLTERVNWNTRAFTFEATGPLCQSGTFEDSFVALGGGRSPQPKVNAHLRTTYTCADGSGTFEIVKHVFININPDGSETFTAQLSIVSGTGAYEGLRGHLAGGGTTTPTGMSTGVSSGLVTS